MHRVDFVVLGHLRDLKSIVFAGLAFYLSPMPGFAAGMGNQHLNAKLTSSPGTSFKSITHRGLHKL